MPLVEMKKEKTKRSAFGRLNCHVLTGEYCGYIWLLSSGEGPGLRVHLWEPLAGRRRQRSGVDRRDLLRREKETPLTQGIWLDLYLAYQSDKKKTKIVLCENIQGRRFRRECRGTINPHSLSMGCT